jgi:hypothetical protein
MKQPGHHIGPRGPNNGRSKQPRAYNPAHAEIIRQRLEAERILSGHLRQFASLPLLQESP